MAEIRRSVAATDVNGITLLASLGVAACPPCASYDEALRLADERLYRDKAATTLSTPPILDRIDVDVVDVPVAARADGTKRKSTVVVPPRS